MNRIISTLLLASSVITSVHATVTITPVDAGNSSPDKVLSDPGGINSTIGTLYTIPGGVALLGTRTGFDGSSGSWLAAECIQDHVTLTFFDKNGGSYSDGEEAGHARFENDGLGAFEINFIAVAGGGGTGHNIYYNHDDTSVLAFPNFYEFLTSTLVGQNQNLSEFSHIYFYGTKLSAVPEPSTVISLISVVFIGLVAFRRRWNSKLS